PQLEWVELESRGELVEHALEPERALDEAGRAEGGVRRQVQLRPVGLRADVLAGVEHLDRPVGGPREARPADRVDVLGLKRDERPVRARAGAELLNRAVAVAR